MAKHVLAVVGINWRTSPISVRENVVFSDRVIPEALVTIRRFGGCLEAMILSTCNRVEVYVSTQDADPTIVFLKDFLASFHDRDDIHFDRYMYAYTDEEAGRHLLKVACGLDSMVVGENEILHQLKAAYKLASQEGALGGMLAFFLEEAVKVGRAVRRETKINAGAVSVATVACDLAQKIFGTLSDRRILILGTGKIGKQTIRNLARCGAGEIVVAARNQARGQELARTFAARAVDFSDWLRYLPDTDIVISSTSSPHYVVRLEDVKRSLAVRSHRPLFFIDIAVPRDVDPTINRLDDVYLYNIDDLKGVSESNLKLRRKEIGASEKMIETRLEQVYLKMEKLKAGPTIEALNKKFDNIVNSELSQWAPPGSRAEIRNLIARIKGKFLHHPMTKLKEAAEDGGIYRYTETIQRLFELDPHEHETEKKS